MLVGTCALAAFFALNGTASATRDPIAPDWSQFQHDAARTGASPATGPIWPVRVPGWPVDCGYDCNSGPVISQVHIPDETKPRQAIFTGSNFVRMIFGYGADGEPLPGNWPTHLGPDSLGGSIYFPAVGRGGNQTAVFGVSIGDRLAWGSVYAVDGQGENRAVRGDWPWTYSGRAQIYTFTPALAQAHTSAEHSGTLYFTYRDIDVQDDDMFLTGLRADGKARQGWPVETGGTAYLNGPAVGPDGTVYLAAAFPSGQSSFHYAIEAFTPAGETKPGWPVQLGGDNSSMYLDVPAIAPDGTVYAGVEDAEPFYEGSSHYYALTPDGQVKDGWPVELPTSIIGTPTIAPDGTTYVATHTAGGSERVASVYAFATDGKIKSGWPLRFEHWGGGNENGEILGIAVDAHGNVFFGSGDTMYGYAPDGKLLPGWPLRVSGATWLKWPALADDGTLYFLNGPQGKIYAVRSMVNERRPCRRRTPSEADRRARQLVSTRVTATC